MNRLRRSDSPRFSHAWRPRTYASYAAGSTGRVAALQPGLGIRCQRHPDFTGNRPGHFALNRQHALELAFVGLCPDVPIGLAVDELRRHFYSGPVTNH